MEAYKSHNGLTQCFNCQNFGHVSANCKQPPKCLWFGGGHVHKDCPESVKESNSTPRCCNCMLKEAERPHPAYYRGCSAAKNEMQRKKNQKSAKYGETPRRFSSRLITPGHSFDAAVCNQPTSQTQSSKGSFLAHRNTTSSRAHPEQGTCRRWSRINQRQLKAQGHHLKGQSNRTVH